MLQTMITWRALPKASAKRYISALLCPALRSRALQGGAPRLGFGSLPADGASRDKLAVHPAVLDEMFQRAVEECDVSANVDLEIVIGQARSKQRALGDRRHPIAIQAGFEVGIDHKNFAACLLRVIKIFGGHRLVIGNVTADKDN